MSEQQPHMARAWAMPSRHTFTIKPIAELLARYLPQALDWVDPFAGWHSPARHRNDLNPEAPTEYHEDAVDFVRRFDLIGGFIFDPPYSPRQISECYKRIGRPCGTTETQNAVLYAAVKDNAAFRMQHGGLAICCGWNSNGMGLKRNFTLIDVLIVAHGAAHNDTIVTVERKA